MSACEEKGRRPSWLKKDLPDSALVKKINSYLKFLSLETVCTNSRCPNVSECYSKRNVSFLILGNVCTRNCLFCAISAGKPAAPDQKEPARIAQAARMLGLKYIVITSVTRDDLAEGGAGHFADTVKAIKKAVPRARVEALVSDFMGSRRAVDRVIESGIDVFSHNMEAPERLFRRIRPGFDYSRSLDILRYAASRRGPDVKSGFMVGVGENEKERDKLLRDIRETGCAFVAIGQYLRPKNSRLPVAEYIRPSVFSHLRRRARSLGFRRVASGPFVRTSYSAGTLYAV